MPMVAVLGHYAPFLGARQRPHARLQLAVVWRCAGDSRPVLPGFIPRLPAADAPASGLAGRGARVAGEQPPLQSFAVTQIAASFLLLAGASVLMKTLFVLEQSRPPFDSANVLALNLPVMSYGKTPQQVSEFYREVKASCAHCPAWSTCLRGFSVPWRDELGLTSALLSPHRAQARADGKRFPRQVPFRFPGILSTFGRAHSGRPRFQRRRQGRLRTRCHHQSEPGEPAFSRPEPAQSHDLVDRRCDQVHRHQLRARRIIAVVPDFDDENIIPSPAMTIYQPIDQEGWNGQSLCARAPGCLCSDSGHSQTIHRLSPDQPVEKASTAGATSARKSSRPTASTPSSLVDSQPWHSSSPLSA